MRIKDKDYDVVISPNGIKMIVGNFLMWRITPIYQGRETPFVLSVSFGGMAEGWNANYRFDEDRLTIANLSYSSNEVYPFFVNGIDMAETIILSNIKGRGEELPPLHNKLYYDTTG